ncbi:MAG TPA: nuclear transport factor 2 family protein [Verrucomicrobiae bacterium]|nr:nuclear transport factor 2 family protein [Verrucomicrobiae bacterium]
MNAAPSVFGWLEEFAACVRNRDLERGRQLFDPGVRSFGTRAEDARDLSDLLTRQWTRVWFNTRGFRFLEETIEELASEDGSQVCVLALWESEGLTAEGRPFRRRGRCTVVLRRRDADATGYVAVHTHFSKTPADEL